jgi:hypothetical protein
MYTYIVFWSGSGFISSYLLSNIVIYYVNAKTEVPFFSLFTFLGFVVGFIRGYTGKSIIELLVEN